MDPNDKDRFVDDLLDASLRRYRSEEPRAGLENRILANVRASDRALQPRRWVWAWTLAASATVLILAVVVLRFTSRPASRTAGTLPALQTIAPKPEPQKMVAVAPWVSHIPGRPVRALRSPAPESRRPEQFPTPSPLSEQEKLLLRYVESMPLPELAIQTGTKQTEQLSIPKLRIAALEIKPLAESENAHRD